MSSDIPGPRPWPLIGNLLNIDLENSVQSVVNIGKQYAPICKLRLGGEDKVFVTGYQLANELCSRKDFVKFPSGAVAKLRDVMTEGLFTAHDDEWFWGPAHRVLVPAFGPMSIKAMFPEMHDIAMQMVMRWARFGENEAIDATSDFTRLTIDTLALCGMDMRLNSFYKDDLHPFIGSMVNVLVQSANRAERPDWLASLYRNANAKFDQDNAFLHAVAQEVIEKRRQTPKADKKDLLDAMLNGKDPKTGEHLTDKTVVDNMITFLIAGHETTACLLGFFFALVLKNPDCYTKVRREVDTVLGTDSIEADHVSQFIYVKACLKEALRLYPPSAGFSLAATGDDATDGPVIIGGKYQVKRNQAVFVVLPNIHRDPEAWGPDVDEFRPERMLDENFKTLPPGCYKPFGNGMRACIGSEFALQESILAVALLFQKFDFEFVDPNYELTIKQALTLKPRDLLMYAKLRPGIDVLTLQREMLYGKSGVNRPGLLANPCEENRVAFVDRSQSLKPLLIFYGSNTGTCQGLAEILRTIAPHHGFNAAVQPLDAARKNLPRNLPIVLITSTMYEGQAPDNGADFLNWLQEEEDLCIDGVTFAIFGCGSRDWKDTFQRTPIAIDQLMSDNGAKRMASRGIADVSEGSVLADFETWQSEELWPGIARYYHNSATTNAKTDVFDIDEFSKVLAKDSSHAFQASVLQVVALTHSEDRLKYHMKLELPKNIKYHVGDYLELVPENSAEDVECLMGVLQDHGCDLADPMIPMMCTHLELRHKASAKQVDLLLKNCTDKSEGQALSALAKAINMEERRPSVIQLLKRYSSINLPLQQLAMMLPPLRPRQYSISSSPLASPNSLTITWSLIKHAAPVTWQNEAPIFGLSSQYLASLKAGDSLSCSIRAGQQRFRPPIDIISTPMIMICAGAGVAPFRGFVQDRVERLIRDPSLAERLAPALLYVGCRSPEQALHAAELQTWQGSGAVKVRFVYSRYDAALGKSILQAAHYVQDKIWEDREELVELWDRGAKVFVCGSRGVSHGVRSILQKIYKEKAEMRCGSKTDDDAENWWVEVLRDRCAVEVF